MSTYKRGNTNKSLFIVKHNFFQKWFFRFAVIIWNKLDLNIRNSESLNIFKKNLLIFTRPSESSVFNCNYLTGTKLLTRLKLGLSHLCERKVECSHQVSIKPTCSSGRDTETLAHFLLNCPNYLKEKTAFLNIIRNIDWNNLRKKDFQVTGTVPCSDNHSNKITNTLICNVIIDFVIAAMRFDVPLF